MTIGLKNSALHPWHKHPVLTPVLSSRRAAAGAGVMVEEPVLNVISFSLRSSLTPFPTVPGMYYLPNARMPGSKQGIEVTSDPAAVRKFAAYEQWTTYARQRDAAGNLCKEWTGNLAELADSQLID